MHVVHNAKNKVLSAVRMPRTDVLGLASTFVGEPRLSVNSPCHKLISAFCLVAIHQICSYPAMRNALQCAMPIHSEKLPDNMHALCS